MSDVAKVERLDVEGGRWKVESEGGRSKVVEGGSGRWSRTLGVQGGRCPRWASKVGEVEVSNAGRWVSKVEGLSTGLRMSRVPISSIDAKDGRIHSERRVAA